jgi:hypothetical protein
MHADAGMANHRGRNQFVGGERRPSHEPHREHDVGRDREMRDGRGRDTRDWHERDFASDSERDDRFMPDYNYNYGSSDRDVRREPHVAHHDGRFARDERADTPYYGDRDPQRRWSSHGGGERERGPHYGKGPRGFTWSDERIKELVSEALHDDEHVDATEITVEVKSGEVMLSGTVDDRRTKRMAEDCALRVSGVKDVQNQIRVSDQRSQSAPGTQDRTSSTTPSLESSKHLRS